MAFAMSELIPADRTGAAMSATMGVSQPSASSTLAVRIFSVTTVCIPSHADDAADELRRLPIQREGARRALNVAVAAIGIVLTAPIMLTLAVAVKLSSPGPVLYRQKRVGLDMRSTRGGDQRRKVDIGGRPFIILKFRTMRAAKSDDQQQVWAAAADPRITPLGRLLRRTRLDELPQLFNVLAGDMNVVGPRPEQPAIFANLRTKVPNYRARQRVRPGITGRAQITLQYDSCIDDVRRKVVADLEYIETQSLVEDLRIMALTAPVMLFRKGSR